MNQLAGCCAIQSLIANSRMSGRDGRRPAASADFAEFKFYEIPDVTVALMVMGRHILEVSIG
jgi:hypothetical protein